MSFLADPYWLFALLLVPVAVYAYVRAMRARRKSAMRFSRAGALKTAIGGRSSRPHRLFALTLIALAFLVIALADPHVPLPNKKQGVNVVLSLDISGSMSATDYKPSRIDAAKQAAATLIHSLKANDYVGLITFDTGARTSAYLTPDKQSVLASLSRVQVSNGATAIGDGLSLAVDMASSIPNKKRIVILMSDGVNNAGQISIPQAIQYAKDQDVQVYTVGMGSTHKVVLGHDFFGNPVYATFDPTALQQIANETGGEYFQSVDSTTLQKIYRTISEKIQRKRELVSIKDWFVGAAILVLLVELALRYGKGMIIQ